MHIVPALGEVDSHLGRDHAAAAVSGIADDGEAHGVAVACYCFSNAGCTRMPGTGVTSRVHGL